MEWIDEAIRAQHVFGESLEAAGVLRASRGPSRRFNTLRKKSSATGRAALAASKASEYECKFIVNIQLDDGSWDISWKWEKFPN